MMNLYKAKIWEKVTSDCVGPKSTSIREAHVSLENSLLACSGDGSFKVLKVLEALGSWILSTTIVILGKEDLR